MSAGEIIVKDSDYDDIFMAICVTEDALTLHEMHKVIMDLQYNLNSMPGKRQQ